MRILNISESALPFISRQKQMSDGKLNTDFLTMVFAL